VTATSRIELLYAGGTIGMVPSAQGLAPGGDVAAQTRAVIAAARAGTGTTGSDQLENVDVDFAELEHIIDSSNATPEDWQQIIDHLTRNRKRYDGFVVLHGTDTLAYSAAAAAFSLTGFGKPVIFTGSQLPLGVPGSDVPDNVIGALIRAANAGATAPTPTSATRGPAAPEPPVKLYFDGALLNGARATKISAIDRHGFASPDQLSGPLTGIATGERDQPEMEPPCGWPAPAPYRRHDVAVVTLTPGMTTARFLAETSSAPEAVILRAYGLGDGPSDEPGLEQAIRGLTFAGIPVVVTSQCLRTRIDLDRYAAGQFFERARAIGAGDMTLEATYAKVQFLLSQDVGINEFARWLRTNIAGELACAIEPSQPRPARISA
jgi:L-asparaginase